MVTLWEERYCQRRVGESSKCETFLYLDLSGGYTGRDICKNLPSCISDLYPFQDVC